MNINSGDGSYLKFLTESEVETLHVSSLEILEKTGVIVDNGELQEALANKGARVDEEADIVYLPPGVVEGALDQAPSGFSVFERGEDETELLVEGNVVHTHTTGGPSYIHDRKSGKRRNALLQDVGEAARVVSHLDNIHAYSPLVSPTDVVPGTEEVEMINAAIRNTHKVVENPVSSGKHVELLNQIFCAVAGGEEKLKEKPLFIVSVSPVSPLNFDRGSAGALLEAAKYELPIKVLPAPSTGATSPVTFAGALAQQNAELLAGLTMVQVVSPGLPTTLAPRLSIMDMRTSFVSWGTTELGAASARAVQLINSYDLPSDVYGLASDSKVMDQQLGYERAMNGILPATAGANFLSGAGGLESLKSCSLSQLVVDNEIFGMILDTVSGFEISEETLALDVIEGVGPGGDFLRERHTLNHTLEGEQYESALGDRRTWEQWLAAGKKEISQVAEEEVEKILKDASPVELEGNVEAELDEVLEEARSYYKDR